jgi:hypothetical protein
MAYADDVAALNRLGKYRLIALICALGCLFLSLFLENGRWLDWPRAIAWTTAGVISVLEGRLMKKLGRDADFCWLRAVVMFLVAIYCIAAR